MKAKQAHTQKLFTIAEIILRRSGQFHFGYTVFPQKSAP